MGSTVCVRRLRRAVAPLALLSLAALASRAFADDWPTYGHDEARSLVTRESLPLPLKAAWIYTAAAPSPSWPPQARRDIWNSHYSPQLVTAELSPNVTYDRADHVVIAAGRVYIASSTEDSVTCLDANRGEILWRFFTEGPVRLAPTVADGMVYFGSDDGQVYCLNAVDGELAWSFRPAPKDRRIPGAGRVISSSPVRSGVVVKDGVAQFVAGLFPNEGVYICAVDAANGSPIAIEKSDTLSSQGYLVASDTRLFVPTGRSAPAIFDRASLEPHGSLPGQSGSWALLAGESVLFGPAVRMDSLTEAREKTNDWVAAFPGVRVVVAGDTAYLQSKTDIAFMDRDPDQGQDPVLWRTKTSHPYSMILAGDVLFAGGTDSVIALDATGGQTSWQAEVDGDAHSLAVSGGALWVSTSEGKVYCFRKVVVGPARRTGRDHTLTTLASATREDARRIMRSAEIPEERRGYCLIAGPGAVDAAAALARTTELQVVALENDPAAALIGRRRLNEFAILPSRASVHCVDPKVLPYSRYMADFVIALPGAKRRWDPSELLRCVRPEGGALIILGQDQESSRDWLSGKMIPGRWTFAQTDNRWVVTRGAILGAGEWTSLYADPGNTACSGDELRGPVALQWFGAPGPREIIDRHHRPMSPLAKDGRVFVPGNERIYAVDCYNGTLRWETSLPGSRRLGVPRAAGHQALGEDHLYAAVGRECWRLNTKDGRAVAKHMAPDVTGKPREWGYLQWAENTLVGTVQPENAAYSKLSVSVVNELYGDGLAVVVSDAVFAMDPATGELRWVRRAPAVMNNCIAVGDGVLYAIETRDKQDKPHGGRMTVKEFSTLSPYLVALDLSTGATLWERPVATKSREMMYLCHADGVVLRVGSFNREGVVVYEMQASSAADGSEMWRDEYLPGQNVGGSHGEQDQHPVISEGVLYTRPFSFDLATGARLDYVGPKGSPGGCGAISGSANYLFGRQTNPTMYPLGAVPMASVPLTRVTRPGCWVNTIAAGGMVLIPESSSGCTCSFAVQTSLAFAPVE